MAISSRDLDLSALPVIVPFLDPKEVDPEFRNEIMVSVIYTVKPGCTNHKDESQQIILKQFARKAISEDQRSYLNGEMKRVYHNSILRYYDVHQDDYYCQQRFNNAEGEYPDDWDIKLPYDQQTFVRYFKAESVGCGHYIRGCHKRCETCKKFYPCRICHDDAEDHTFPRYETTTVKCNYCHKEQPFAQQCMFCNRMFASYCCYKCKILCGIGPDAKPNYHCDGCGVCNVGYIEFSQHCDKCNNCYNPRYFSTHKCVQVEEKCMVCLNRLKNSIYGRTILECGHQMHWYCYQEFINRSIFQCPVCKKFLPIQSDRERVTKWQQEYYNRTFITDDLKNIFVQTTCNDCGLALVNIFHPTKLYYCPNCKIFNSEIRNYINSEHGRVSYKIQQELYGDRLLQPKFSQYEDVAQVVQSLDTSKSLADILKELEIEEITTANVNVLAIALNQLPSSVDELKMMLDPRHQQQLADQNNE